MVRDKWTNFLTILRIVATVPLILFSSTAIASADDVCLLDGDGASLEARLSLIAAAQLTIDAAYFEFDDDRVGRCMTQTLIDAAQRGVNVRLLIDGCNNLLGEPIRSALIDSGVVVREYHPARWSKLHWSPYRMHDKLLIGDGEMMIVGGRNLAAGFFGMSSKRNFSDRDVLIVGPTAQHAAGYFHCRWHSPDAMPIRAKSHSLCRWLPLQEPPNLWQFGSQIEDESTFDNLCKKLRLAPRQTDASSQCGAGRSSGESSPECFDVGQEKICFLHSGRGLSNPCGDITSQLLALVRQAQMSIVMETPYLVLTDEFELALRAARARSVTVHIVTNSLVSTNKILAQAGYESQKKKLLQMGIHLWEFQGPETLHAKCWVVDDCAVLGSYNLDSRAALYDTQTAVVIRDSSVAAAVLTSIVRRHQANSVQPTIRGDIFDPCQIRKHASLPRQALLHIVRPAVPLMKRHL